MKGGDWVTFHSIARELAANMRAFGFSVWELRPERAAPAGIAAIFYWFTDIEEPWVVLPLNAVRFGLAAAELYRLLKRVTGWEKAWLAIMPFLFFPSSALLYSQLHKDVFSVAGLLLLFNSMIDLWDIRPGFGRITPIVSRVLAGLFLVWLVRPYLVPIVVFGWWVGILALLAGSLWFRGNAAGSAWVILLVLSLQAGFVVLTEHTVSGRRTTATPLSEELQRCASQGIPGRLVCRLDRVRRGFISRSPDAGSMIGTNVRFQGLDDVLAYLPRAVLIGLAAPFPSQWFASGVRPGGDLMRRAAVIEMLVSYSVLSMCLYLMFRHRLPLSPMLVAVCAMALVVLVTLALAIPNVGTLYRMRLAPWHVLIGLGLTLLLKEGLHSERKIVRTPR